MTTNLTDFDDYESWGDICLESIKYKGKTLEDWAVELSLPDVDFQILEEVEFLNKRAIQLTEKIYSNTSLSKSTYYLAKASYNQKLHNEKCSISDSISDSGSTKRLPSQDNLERMALEKSMKEWRLMVKAEIIFEFWQTHNYKINQINTRLTSLNILKNIESKQQG
jgi:hypothetical protein